MSQVGLMHVAVGTMDINLIAGIYEHVKYYLSEYLINLFVDQFYQCFPVVEKFPPSENLVFMHCAVTIMLYFLTIDRCQL